MPNCPKCGSKVREEMSFCPKCGASLKAEQRPVLAEAAVAPVPARAERVEKREKEEKGERRERMEKYERREFGYIGPLIGGLFLMFVGFLFYLIVTAGIRWEVVWALFFVVIGILIIAGAVYAAMTAARRHPAA